MGSSMDLNDAAVNFPQIAVALTRAAELGGVKE
jgi:hypothetical protein